MFSRGRIHESENQDIKIGITQHHPSYLIRVFELSRPIILDPMGIEVLTDNGRMHWPWDELKLWLLPEYFRQFFSKAKREVTILETLVDLNFRKR